MNEDTSDRETGREPGGPSGAEPSAAEASRALAERLARTDVVAHGSVPFRSPTEPERSRSRSSWILRFAVVMVVGLAVGIILSVVIALAIAVWVG